MKYSNVFKKILLSLFCILCITVSSTEAFSKSKHKNNKVNKHSSNKEASIINENEEQIKAKLDLFGQNLAKEINKHILPSENKKAVSNNHDGSYTARYKAIDSKTMSSSVKPIEKSKVANGVTHIGYLKYNEVEYACTAKTKQEALKGPFLPVKSEKISELIKYRNGKWTY